MKGLMLGGGSLKARLGIVASGLEKLPRRALRAARHARYHVAVWIRGEAQQR